MQFLVRMAFNCLDLGRYNLNAIFIAFVHLNALSDYCFRKGVALYGTLVPVILCLFLVWEKKFDRCIEIKS